MTITPKRLAALSLALAAAAYLAICGWMYTQQTALIFHPTHEGAAIETLASHAGNEHFELSRDELVLRGALVLSPVETPAPALIYFGGNAEAIALKHEAFGWMPAAGAHLVLLPYRGYDDNPGSPDADAMRADALAAFDQLAAHPRVDPHKIYAMGYSLGSGLASHLANKRELAGLLLVSPYRRLGEIAEASYPWLPVNALLDHDFDTLGIARVTDEQLVVVHGALDELIPLRHGQDVVAAWKGKAKLIALPDHAHNGGSAHPRTQTALRELMGL